MALALEEAAHDVEVLDAQIVGARIVNPTIVDGRIIDGRIIDGAVVKNPPPQHKTRRTLHFHRERAHGEIVVGIAFVLAVLLVYIVRF
jgi:hypothetical protein